MKCNSCLLKEEVAKYKNTIAICETELYCFLGVKIVEYEDIYYILKNVEGVVSYFTCVGRIIFLIDKLSKEDYDYVEEAFDLTLSDNEDEKDDSEKLVCYCKENIC